MIRNSTKSTTNSRTRVNNCLPLTRGRNGAIRNDLLKKNDLTLPSPSSSLSPSPTPTQSPPPSPPPPMSRSSRKIQLAKDNVVRNIAYRDLEAIQAANNGILTHDSIQHVINKYTRLKENVTRAHLDYRRSLVKNGKPLPGEVAVANPAPVPTPNVFVETGTLETNVSPLSLSSDLCVRNEGEANEEVVNQEEIEQVGLVKNKGGRPKGTTNKAKSLFLQNVRLAMQEASTLCIEEKDRVALTQRKRVEDGKYAAIISSVRTKYELDDSSFSTETILSRIKHRNPTGLKDQIKSPLEGIEPEIVEWCRRLAAMGEALTKYELMSLADDIIRGTVYEKKYYEYREKVGISLADKEATDESILGERWFYAFLTRWSIEVKSGKCLIQNTCRSSWCTKANFENMYDVVYRCMVECKVAVELDVAVMYDRDGEITEDKQKMVGRPSRFKLTRPDRCVFVDETGCNTNQLKDGHLGGSQVISGTDQKEGAKTGIANDLHFTVLAFTAGTGEVIMCSVIMKSERKSKVIPPSWRWGIDMTKNVLSGRTEVETWDLNRGNDVCKGGPVCRFNGVDIPTFVCCTPNASITSELLADMLCELDKRTIFERSEEIGVPFLLIDGHGSRTRLPFLRYINSNDTRWKCCIGVPYGTHIWQPHDSSELNGSFKIKLYKEKAKYLKGKPPTQQKFVSTDIIPILNRSWEGTLNNKRFAKKSIQERGWNPLNYVLLNDPRLKDKDTEKENLDSNIAIANNTVAGTESFLKTFRHKNGKVFASRLSSLVDEEKRSEGRKRKSDELRKSILANDGNIEKLVKTLGRPRSGNLAAIGAYELSEHVRDAIETEEKKTTDKQQATSIRKIDNHTIHVAKFRKAAKAFFTGGKGSLPVADLKTILKEIKEDGDTPIKSLKKADLEQQLHRRRDRMEIYRSYDPNDELVNKSDDYEEDNVENISFDIFCDAKCEADGDDQDVALAMVDLSTSTISTSTDTSSIAVGLSEVLMDVTGPLIGV